MIIVSVTNNDIEKITHNNVAIVRYNLVWIMVTIFVLFLWFNCIVYKSLTCHFSLTTSVYVDLKPRIVSNKGHCNVPP